MTTNLIIGIGGTGAKCVESAIHCFAGGMGPSKVTVAFVEVDKANGNLQRATRTLALYRTARQAYTHTGTCSIDPDHYRLMATKCEIFAKSAQNGEVTETVWTPIPKDKEDLNLEQVFGMRPGAAGHLLFDSLFSRPTDGDKESGEQTMRLYNGSRGRPNVGCALLGACAHERAPWWGQLLNSVVDAANTEQDPVKVLLIGSTFGGTGASGIPAIARLLRKQLADRAPDANKRVTIGAILMLPYFWFASSGDNTAGDGRSIVAKSDQFINVSSSALKFYYDLIDSEKNDETKTFNQVTLLGWPEQLQVTPGYTGGERQNNPPLLPELYAGLAAAHFFAVPKDQRRRFYLFGLKEDVTELSWDDLPSFKQAGESNLGKPKNFLGQFTRFAVAFRYVYRNVLKPPHWTEYRRQSWYQTLIGKAPGNPNLNLDDSQKRLSSLKEYLDVYLKWIGAMALPAVDGQDLKPRFLRANVFARRSAADEYGVMLKPENEYEKSVRADFPKLVPDATSLHFGQIFRHLSQEPDPKETDETDRTDGLGVFVSRLYRACSVDTTDKIKPVGGR